MKEILYQTPKFIRDRFYSIRSYVWYSLFPSDEFERKLNRKYSKAAKSKFKKEVNNIIDEAAIVLFIFFIRRFLEEGTKVAQQAADIFKELELDGFWIGSEKYEGRNENVMLGETLSNSLLNNLSQDLKSLIVEKNHPYEIIDLYRDIIKKL